MPPVAETFKDAVKRHLGRKSLRAFAKELADGDGGSNDPENWRRALNRYETEWPDAESAKIIARALGVPRTHLPRERTIPERLDDLDDHLTALEVRLEGWFVERQEAGVLVASALEDIQMVLARLERAVAELRPQDGEASQGDGS
jgi:broad specificity phosphatase PhoE